MVDGDKWTLGQKINGQDGCCVIYYTMCTVLYFANRQIGKNRQ